MRAEGLDEAAIRRTAIGRGFGIRDGNGIMFISATGAVMPSGFLPLVAGNVRDVMPLDVYRYAPLFRGLRRPELLRGRCGACEFRTICGGSRARAWAATGDVFAEDPLCTWRADAPTAA
jgi:radical SAM protein with 4Fe4S-binding SPASM domain